MIIFSLLFYYFIYWILADEPYWKKYKNLVIVPLIYMIIIIAVDFSIHKNRYSIFHCISYRSTFTVYLNFNKTSQVVATELCKKADDLVEAENNGNKYLIFFEGMSFMWNYKISSFFIPNIDKEEYNNLVGSCLIIKSIKSKNI